MQGIVHRNWIYNNSISEFYLSWSSFLETLARWLLLISIIVGEDNIIYRRNSKGRYRNRRKKVDRNFNRVKNVKITFFPFLIFNLIRRWGVTSCESYHFLFKKNGIRVPILKGKSRSELLQGSITLKFNFLKNSTKVDESTRF